LPQVTVEVLLQRVEVPERLQCRIALAAPFGKQTGVAGELAFAIATEGQVVI